MSPSDSDRKNGVQLNEREVELEEKRSQITIFKSPFVAFRILAFVVLRWIADIPDIVMRYKPIAISCAIFVLFITYLQITEGEEWVEQRGERALWWMFMGILSSVGLGTGLHTFVLYLGPLIAKTTMAAYECKSTNIAIYGPDAFLCAKDSDSDADSLGFWSIFALVEFETVFWGIGTAIGELPPYFVARAARLAGKSSDLDSEMEELNEAKQSGSDMQKFLANGKLLALKLVQKLGFVGILLFASIPNPLFDLAGLLCGHYLVPFYTFFLATLIGKAFVKAQMQAIVISFVFSKHHVDHVASFVDRLLPFLHGKLHAIIENEKAKFHRTHDIQEGSGKGFLGLLWDVFLTLMILYFVVSLANALVQHHLKERDDRRLQREKVLISSGSLTPARRMRREQMDE